MATTRGPVMSRIPAAASVTLVGLLPVCAVALGLGEIQPRSYLNEPFAAEIPLVSDTAGELAGLDVALASSDTFAQYGLQPPVFLGDLSFAVVSTGVGPAIRITSAQPVMEPFVTLLLEVRWPQGRLLREYTVLLDPPAFTGGAARVASPAAEAAAVAEPEPAEAPVVETPAETPAAAPVSPADGTHVVQRNETLWGIADRYRAGSAADINQMMLAIYRANPEAFAGNINRLNAGAVLRIPDRAAIDAVGRGTADAEVRRQNLEWQGGAGGTVERPARLELVPPAEAAPPPATVAGSTAGAKAAADAEESRRLLAVKDAELQALRRRVAELERQAGQPALRPGAEAAVEPEPTAPAAQAPIEAEAEAEAPPVAETPPAAAPVPQKPAAPARPRPAPEGAGSGIVDTLLGLLTNAWLWVAAAVVAIGALVLVRRRAGGAQEPAWRPTTRRPGGEASARDDAGTARGEDMIVIEEEAARTGAPVPVERRAVPRGGDEELPLEKTISTDGPVNLDQSDPLAEADFHMAYGLYDQAADLLVAASRREPARRDLALKLLDVYFVWENREGFLKQARTLHDQIGNESDPDWKRVGIMGRQLCPNEALFAGAAVPEADEMDLAFSDSSGGTVDLPLDADAGGIDFDLSGEADAELDANAPTRLAERPWSSAQTQEIVTLEAPGIDSASTMETPTIESPALTPTMETPTIETSRASRTMETPTVEAPAPEFGATARLQGLAGSGGDSRPDQTAEIDVLDLGLDLAGLDDAARDIGTGLQEALPDLDLNLDLGTELSAQGDESTSVIDSSPTLGKLKDAVERGGTGGLVDDTAEQPGVGGSGDSLIAPGLSVTSDDLPSLDIDLDSMMTPAESDLTATGLRAIGPRRPEDPTMTEVGTKLDLARAYADMGDPDGARSILNEVIEEGDPAQRQEARQLLDNLDG